jgi:hypothetical protein
MCKLKRGQPSEEIRQIVKVDDEIHGLRPC